MRLHLPRVLLWSDGDRCRSAAAREWFYDMSDLLRARGFDVDLNVLTDRPYDLALIHWARLNRLREVHAHSPRAHLGVLNPGYLGFPPAFTKDKHRRHDRKALAAVVENVDFLVVSSFMWREMLLPFGRRVYQVIDYVRDLPAKKLKTHEATNGLVIGYHGNDIHFAHDFFPHGARALARLSREFDFTLKIVTTRAAEQPRIQGVKTQYVEWSLETIEQELQTFDIGICPAFADLNQLRDPFTFIRNPNRVMTLLAYGIPSVTSPLFQSCQDLSDGTTTLFAVTEEGWYSSLKRLIETPALRGEIGRAGRALVERRFSEAAGADTFASMLQDEAACPVRRKEGLHADATAAEPAWRRLFDKVRAFG